MIKIAMLIAAMIVSCGAAYAGCPGGVCHLKNRATIIEASPVKNIESSPVVSTVEGNTTKVVNNCCCSSVSTKCCTKTRRCRRCCR